ncbi:MAG: hypothetical protein PWP03_761 [Candidatus Woesearchaeota archaeon]|nr:hypothetical protein [Candidatus Woesearchaeota archaeon]MDN5328123.1 hypothetical protein [Candidatus Woesearchaeota archaeon]
MKIAKKDQKIIAYLRQDSRIQLTKLSRKTGIPVSTLFERIKSLTNTVIRKPTITLRFSEIGYQLQVFVMIKSQGKNRSDIIEFLAKNKNVNSVWRINNHFDILAEMVFRNLADFDEFIQNLEERFILRDIEFEFVVNEVEREKFFADPNLIELLNNEIKTKTLQKSELF